MRHKVDRSTPDADDYSFDLFAADVIVALRPSRSVKRQGMIRQYGGLFKIAVPRCCASSITDGALIPVAHLSHTRS
jgi:hypothetical protein